MARVLYPVLNTDGMTADETMQDGIGPWPVEGTDYVTWTPPWFRRRLELHEEDCPCAVCEKRREQMAAASPPAAP
jgi:hypothetical protein